MIVFPTDHSEEERKFLLAAQNSERAKTILNKLPKPVQKKPVEKMDRADRDDSSAVEKSLLFRELLDESDWIEDLTERLTHQGAIAVWVAANREEATASLTAARAGI